GKDGEQEHQKDKERPKTTIVAVDKRKIPFVPGVHRVHVDFIKDGEAAAALIDLALEAESFPPLELSLKNWKSVGTEEEQQDEDGSTGNPRRIVDVVLADVVPELGEDRLENVARSLEMCRAVWEFVKLRMRTQDEVGRNKAGVLVYVPFVFFFYLISISYAFRDV
ncbi:hypothetical protein C0991_010938, partial [Blastosporella zonata]